MDTHHTQFPFTGLHIYQRMQEAWSRAQQSTSGYRLRQQIESEVRRAVLGIARATARSGRDGAFRAELEGARGAIHAAGAIVDQLARRGTPIDEELQGILSDAARMLGALIRTMQATQQAGQVAAGQNGAPTPAEA